MSLYGERPEPEKDEKGREYMSKEQGAHLYRADPNCRHVYTPNHWSGIECAKCRGWYCL